MANVKLMKRVLRAIKKDPKRWNQADWRCNTGMCFAGWACQLAGGKWAFGARAEHRHFLLANSQDNPEALERALGKSVVNVETRATRLLGLETDPFHNLFLAVNTLSDLEDLVADYERQEA